MDVYGFRNTLNVRSIFFNFDSLAPRICFFRIIFLRFTNYISNDVTLCLGELPIYFSKNTPNNTGLVLGSISSLGSTLYIPIGSSKCYTLSMVLKQLHLGAALGITVTNKP